MALTMHEAGADAVLEKLMADPHGVEAVEDAYAGLRDGRWNKEYVDSIGQSGRRSPRTWPMRQVAAFIDVHALIVEGSIARVPVRTDGPPQPDKERKANAAALSDLPHPFIATVDLEQNGDEGDGVVEWSEPIEVSATTGIDERDADGSLRRIPLHFWVPPGSAILEIGSSLPSRTMMHLRMNMGRVARWPYGQSCFWLFLNLDFVSMQRERVKRLKQVRSR